jgi:hypothetical protein
MLNKSASASSNPFLVLVQQFSTEIEDIIQGTILPYFLPMTIKSVRLVSSATSKRRNETNFKAL